MGGRGIKKGGGGGRETTVGGHVMQAPRGFRQLFGVGASLSCLNLEFPGAAARTSSYWNLPDTYRAGV